MWDAETDLVLASDGRYDDALSTCRCSNGEAPGVGTEGMACALPRGLSERRSRLGWCKTGPNCIEKALLGRDAVRLWP